MKRIYLATPVNARKEKTMHTKLTAACKRVDEMQFYLAGIFPDAEFTSVFDSCVIAESEATIMGWCVETVMSCDMIVLDDGWENSKGCTVERFVAMQYGKQVRTFNSFLLKDKLNK